jgi:hypothetical protein
MKKEFDLLKKKFSQSEKKIVDKSYKRSILLLIS